MEEKRKYIRIAVPIVISYRIVRTLPTTKKAIVKDFSEGGIRFPVYEKLPTGTVLQICIEAPFNTLPIAATGESVWVRPLSAAEGREIYDVGIRFIQIDEYERRRVVKVVKRYLGRGKEYRAV